MLLYWFSVWVSVSISISVWLSGLCFFVILSASLYSSPSSLCLQVSATTTSPHSDLSVYLSIICDFCSYVCPWSLYWLFVDFDYCTSPWSPKWVFLALSSKSHLCLRFSFCLILCLRFSFYLSLCLFICDFMWLCCVCDFMSPFLMLCVQPFIGVLPMEDDVCSWSSACSKTSLLLSLHLSRPRLIDGNRTQHNNKKSTKTEQEDTNWNYPETRSTRCRRLALNRNGSTMTRARLI